MRPTKSRWCGFASMYSALFHPGRSVEARTFFEEVLPAALEKIEPMEGVAQYLGLKDFPFSGLIMTMTAYVSVS